MQELSPAFRDAMNLLGQDPLPEDAEARLEALEAQIRPDEVEAFGDLWETYLTTPGTITAPPRNKP